MMRKTLGTLAISLAASSSMANAALTDGGFETQAATVTNYCYFGQVTPGGPACPSGAWTGSGLAGLQSETNTDFPGTLTPDGTHYAFVQGTVSGGTLSQTFIADTTGLFSVDWLAAGRAQGGDESYTLTINGQTIGTFSTVSGQPFTEVTSSPFSFTAGSTYTLAFNGLFQGGTTDNTAFIDAVRLIPAAIPEPAAWMMMLLGFAGIGLATNRNRRKLAPIAQ
jgi:hypothetical protein